MRPLPKVLEHFEMPIGRATSGTARQPLRSWSSNRKMEHKVRMRDFEAWLESNGRSPAEMSLKTRLRELLRK